MKKLDYTNPDLLFDREVVVALETGTNLSGKVKYVSDDVLVLVNEPTSSLEIETNVVHTVINPEHVCFIQFKTKLDK